jgi:cytochrome c-type biogenesis protein CcmH/NrfG
VQAATDGRAGAAVERAERASALAPWSPELRGLAADLVLQTPPRDAALREAQAILEQAVRRHPGRVELWHRLAAVYAERVEDAAGPELELARQAFARAASLAPNHGLILREWARLDLRTGALEAAEAKLQRALQLDATDLEAWLMLARFYQERALPFPAMNAYRQAAELAPDSVTAQLGLARSLQALGDPRSARRAAEQARRLDPANQEAAELVRSLEQAAAEREPGG